MRLEIEAALTRGVRVIPVLVDAARMPRPDQLPACLTPLARHLVLRLPPGHYLLPEIVTRLRQLPAPA